MKHLKNMNTNKHSVFLLLAFFILSSCSGIVQRYHQQIDSEMMSNESKNITLNPGDKFNFFKERGIIRGNQDSNFNGINSSNNKNVYPKVKRQYSMASAPMKKRYTSNDLNDNGNHASLWAGEGKDNYLFSGESKLSNGDLIVINVQGALKDDITVELKRLFPLENTPSNSEASPKKAAAVKDDKKTTSKAASKEPASSNPEAIYDKITSVVVEEVNSSHVMLKGRKQLLFRNKKHTVEIQALVARRDIETNDSIYSSRILEKSIEVIH